VLVNGVNWEEQLVRELHIHKKDNIESVVSFTNKLNCDMS
jgi:hypothetical protein